MPLYGGIDLHANNSVVVLLNAQDQAIYRKRLHNHLSTILEPLSRRHGAIEGIVGCALGLLLHKGAFATPICRSQIWPGIVWYPTISRRQVSEACGCGYSF